MSRSGKRVRNFYFFFTSASENETNRKMWMWGVLVGVGGCYSL